MTENNDIEPVTKLELPLQKFYDAELEEVPAKARQLLEGYSKIPSDEVLPHILEVRNRAWKVYPYPCIGHYRFLDLSLTKSPAYPEIVSRLKSGQQFLDLGCCVGQELRQLVADGVKSENLYGADLHTDFFDIGYDLFKDRDSFNSLFITADILAHESVLNQLKGKIDIIWAGALLHLFDWKHQVLAVKHMLKLLERHPRSMIVGRLMGSSTPAEVTVGQGTEHEQTVYRHDVQSFKKMFHEACDILGEKWETEVEAREWKDENDELKLKGREVTTPPGTLEITFVATRLERLDSAVSHNFVF